MKRVGLSRFSPQEVSRRVQQCLRFEGVTNTNGVATDCVEIAGRQDSAEVLAGDPLIEEQSCSEGRSKSNILSTIKKKLKKTQRNKRCDLRNRSDSIGNGCQCHSENCELHAVCTKHYKFRKHKSNDKCSVWPVASSILRCHNHQQLDKQNDDIAELIPCVADDTDICSCTTPAPQISSNASVNVTNVASGSEMTAIASSSLCFLNPMVSSPGLKVESEGDPPRIPRTMPQEEADNYASPICTVPQADNKDDDPSVVHRVGNLTQELYKLSKYGWYWGPINRSEAESKLVDQPDGAFLVRDSSDDRYILSLSFRSNGKTLHTRIEHSSGLFSFYAQPEPEGHASIVDLIQQSMCYSQSGVFCYSRSRSPGSPSFPVRLTKPISRFTQVRSLQYLSRFVIRQYTRYDHIQKLPLPPRIKGYLEEGHY